jgi:serine phosphatase RsbU (regulator of sigma subunit)
MRDAPIAAEPEPRREPAESHVVSGIVRLRHAIALLLLLGAFLADLNTGYELSSSLFYVVPVAFTAWFVGRRESLIAAVASTVAWFAAQRLDGISLSSPGILYANAVVECAIYLTTAWAVSRVYANRIVERRLTARLSETTAALEREVLGVGELQRGLLPHKLPVVEGYCWQVHYATSARAGGDYYDAFRLPDRRIGAIVADAAGHGAPAAVLMAMAKALFGADPESLFPPDQVLARLNRQLGRMLPPGWFLTACYAVIEAGEGRVTYSLAGHDPPLVVRAAGGGVEQLPARGGLPLGPFVDRPYEAGAARLEPGDTLVLFTDGVTETMSPSQELFGVERVCEALAGTAQMDLEDAKLQLLGSLIRHAAGARAADDTTVLMLRRGCGEGARLPRESRRAPAT